MKKVKNERYDIKRIICGSSDIYSNEYKWTKLDTKNTTNNIVADNESNRKAHSTFRISTVNQVSGSTTKQLVAESKTSKNINKAIKKLKKIVNIERIAAPDLPRNLPNNNKLKEDKSGKKTSNKYIRKKKN